MAKKKPITGTIYLYANPNERLPSASRNYKCKADRVKILKLWNKLYRLENKPHYVIQIAPNVN